MLSQGFLRISVVVHQGGGRSAARGNMEHGHADDRGMPAVDPGRDESVQHGYLEQFAPWVAL